MKAESPRSVIWSEDELREWGREGLYLGSIAVAAGLVVGGVLSRVDCQRKERAGGRDFSRYQRRRRDGWRNKVWEGGRSRSRSFEEQGGRGEEKIGGPHCATTMCRDRQKSVLQV